MMANTDRSLALKTDAYTGALALGMSHVWSAEMEMSLVRTLVRCWMLQVYQPRVICMEGEM